MSRRIIPIVVLALCWACSSPTPTGSTSPEPSTVPTSTPASPISTGSPGSTVSGEEPGAILVVGSWGSGTEPQGAVASAMERQAGEDEIAAILTTGDNFFSDQIDFLMQPYEWATEAGIPFWLSWGDRDVATDERVAAIESRFEAPRWVTHTWGGVDILILDSTQVGSAAQSDFIVAEMARSDRPMIVVVHHPPYSCARHGDTVPVIENWLPLFDDDVVLVLGGHHPNYQRFEDRGTTFVVSAGGGAGLSSVGECPDGHPPLLAAAAMFHFLVIEQVPDRLVIEARDVGGKVIDTFYVIRNT